MSIALAQAGTTSIEPIAIRRMMIRLIRPVFPMRSWRRLRWFGNDVPLLAVGQIHRRLQHHLVGVFDPGVDLDLGTAISRDRYFPQVRDAVFDDRNLHAVLVEDDRRGRHDQRRRLAQDP